MKIGILGTGNMGSALGKIWAQQGHKVVFSYSRSPEKLQAVAASSNAQVGTPREMAEFADVIFLSVSPVVLEEAINAAGSLAGKVLITCVSGLEPDFQGQSMGLKTDLTISMAERIAQLAPDAEVIEAFNTTFAEILQTSRQFGAERPSLFYCGDSHNAKQVVAKLIEETGFEAVDIGNLTKARSLETLASIWVQFAVVSDLFPDAAIKLLRR